MMPGPVLVLGVPSAIVYVLLVVHAVRNRGPRPAALYFGSALVYGVLRATLVERVVHDQPGSLFPYLMALPVVRVGPASAQELLGWSVAVSIAWLVADRLLTRVTGRAGPYRTAALAALGMCAVCLAVETAAIGAGWWVWTIKMPSGLFGRVPLVGLLDWGFVAFDFLLPLLVWTSGGSLLDRAAAFSLFPLHFLLHASMRPLPEPVSLAWNDISHAGIFAYVLVRAIDDAGASSLPHPWLEKGRWMPLAATALVAGATVVADVLSGHPLGVLASLPLLLLGLAALAGPAPALPAEITAPPPQRSGRRQRKAQARPPTDAVWLRVSIVLAIAAGLVLTRAPFHRRNRAFVESLNRGVDRVNAGDLPGAEREMRMGVALRPDNAYGRALLAQVLTMEGRRDDARRELEVALDLQPTLQNALVMLTTLDLLGGRWNEAAKRAEYGRRIYPDRAEFVYQSEVARRRASAEATEAAPPAEAIDAARRGGPSMLAALASLATDLGDRETAAICTRALKPSGPAQPAQPRRDGPTGRTPSPPPPWARGS